MAAPFILPKLDMTPAITDSQAPSSISPDSTRVQAATGLRPGMLRSVHHIALNVKDMQASCQFYGEVLGLHRLTGADIPKTLVTLVAEGKVTNFRTPDGTILDLFWEPELTPPDPDPEKSFTRADHLAFDIAPEQMASAMSLLRQANIPFKGPVIRPTGKGIYFRDPDGFTIEVRCDPATPSTAEAS
ncbi:MAG: VOC family protein [Phormidesmis sp.]